MELVQIKMEIFRCIILTLSLLSQIHHHQQQVSSLIQSGPETEKKLTKQWTEQIMNLFE